MEVSRRPRGGLRVTASVQPLVPAFLRTVFLQSLTAVGQTGAAVFQTEEVMQSYFLSASVFSRGMSFCSEALKRV